VTRRAHKWRAQLWFCGKLIVIGSTYTTAEEAARAFDKTAHRLLGSRAVLNFPDDVSPEDCVSLSAAEQALAAAPRTTKAHTVRRVDKDTPREHTRPRTRPSKAVSPVPAARSSKRRPKAVQRMDVEGARRSNSRRKRRQETHSQLPSPLVLHQHRDQERQGKRRRALSTSTEGTLSDTDSARLSWSSDVTDEETQQHGYYRGECYYPQPANPPSPAALLEFRLSLSEQEKEALEFAAKMVLALRNPAAPPNGTQPPCFSSFPGAAAACHGALPHNGEVALDTRPPMYLDVSHALGHPTRPHYC